LKLAGARLGGESTSREQVDDFQRARIVSAMVEVAAELGYIGATVAPVVARAGVSRRTFYELFDGREECFLAAFEWGLAQAAGALELAYRRERGWREGVRQALAALLASMDAEPELARVCVVEALGAGPAVLARRAAALERLAGALEADAPRPRGASGKPPLGAEGIVGGALSLIHGRLLERASHEAGEPAPHPLVELHGQLMALIVLPYLGARAAAEELARVAPEPPARRSREPGANGSGGRLLERLDMRLTYRTVRCLTFIAEHPGISNRELARGAGIPDEGQASKLLSRLVRLDLIANGGASGPGLPNRWSLTPHGAGVLAAVRRH